MAREATADAVIGEVGRAASKTARRRSASLDRHPRNQHNRKAPSRAGYGGVAREATADAVIGEVGLDLIAMMSPPAPPMSRASWRTSRGFTAEELGTRVLAGLGQLFARGAEGS